MATQPKTLISEEEYLEREKTAPFRSEYYRGEVFPITGQTPNHAQIFANTIAAVAPAVRKRGCRFYAAPHVKVSSTGLYTYPDVAIVCGEPQYDHDRDLLINPTLIFEVLSPSTRDYDRATKFENYRSIPGFTEFLAIAQHEPRVEHWVRQGQFHWQLTDIQGLDQLIHLATLDCDIPLSEIYKDIQFGG